MADTFVKIASVTVGAGGAASMDFTSIPSTYTDLCVKLSARSVASANFDTMYIKFNTSTSNLSSRVLYGSGSSAGSSTLGSAGLVADLNAANNTASTFSNVEVYIPNYAGSSNKSYSVDSVQENNATLSYAELTAGLWSQTTAVNGLSFYFTSNNLAQYSTATLYGILKA